MWKVLTAICTAFIVMPCFAEQKQNTENPYQLYYAEVIRVIDGDTLAVNVSLWPGLFAQYAVRVRGIDTPEIRRVGCEEEKTWGEEAKAQVEKFYPVGRRVRLRDVEFDAFSGRVVAEVARKRSGRWLKLKDELLDRDLAQKWTPDMNDVPWCLLAQER